MRTFRLAALAALTALVAVGCKKDDDEDVRPSRVTILFTTDEHAHLFGVGNEGADWPIPTTAVDRDVVGGVARRATLLANERIAATQRGGESVVVSSGDFSFGTLAGISFLPPSADVANPDLGLMRAMGYEVVALGNHEFDWGPAALAGAVATTAALGQAPPLVLTNVAFDATSAGDDALAALYGERGSGKAITRSRIHVTQRGIRIGFVSSMGFDAARGAANAAPVHFGLAIGPTTTQADFLAAAAAIIQAEVDSLRAEGVDVVVMLGHGGITENPLSPGTEHPSVPGDDERLAALLTGVDLILAGHTHLQSGLRRVTDDDGFEVPILAAPPLGRAVGKVELMLHGNGRPTVIEDQTAFLPVDGTVAPTASQTVRDALASVVAGIEAAFLPATLSVIEGAPVTDDPDVVGDLYFRELCTPSFDVVGLRQPGETNALNLDTDAMLALLNAEPLLTAIGGPTPIAIQNSGSMRANFFAGTGGAGITMADVYRMAPLGADPTTATPGYPLVRAFMTTVELRAAFEGTLPMAYPLAPMYSPDYYLSPAGLSVTYDPGSASVFDPADPLGAGWITRMALVAPDGTETALYDTSVDLSPTLPPGWTGNPLARHAVVTTYYVASFARYFGLDLYADATTETPIADLTTAIVRWPVEGSPSVKDHQVLGAYVKMACAGGDLPPVYDEADALGTVPRRVLCESALAPCF